MNVAVKVLRDTDGDGTPDKTDNDDDGDGINDDQDTTPKVKTPLTAQGTNPTAPVVEGQPYTNTDVVVTANKPGATISSTPVHGLSVNGQGQITGTPSGLTWNGNDEEQTVTIPVTVNHEGDTSVTVNVAVKVLRDTDGDGTPDVRDDDDDNDGISDEVEKQNGTNPKVADTLKPLEIGITRKPNGNAIVTPKKPDGTTYPSGSKVEIPGENGTPITVTIGDNGSGEVPNDNLPKKDVPGTGTVTEPNKRPSKPVDVTTPARKTPTVELEQDPNTGDVTVTPKKPDGSTYPPGTKVEIPGKNGTPIVVIIGQDGKGKVPNKDLPDREVPGNAKITEPGKDPVEVPVVTTPARKTPTVVLEQDPNTGNGTVTPATNGNSGQDTPAPTPTTPIPDVVTPNANHEDTTDASDNGAKSNDSQNVLPNTGTESNATLASLGLLGLLSGFGLVARKKKED